MKNFVLLISLVLLLINVSCNLQDAEVDIPIIDTIPVYIELHHIIYDEATVYTEGDWGPLTVIFDELHSKDSIFITEAFNPILFKTSRADIKVTLKATYLEGDRFQPLIPTHGDCFDECPDPIIADRIVYDTIYIPIAIHPCYGIFKIESEGLTRIDTIIYGQIHEINIINEEGDFPAQYKSSLLGIIHDSIINPSEFTGNLLTNEYDNVITTPSTYEVYFTDMFPLWEYSPGHIDAIYYIKKTIQ